MAAGAHFQINQAANPVPVGTTDVARADVWLGQTVHFVGDSVGNSGPSWTITAWPVGSIRNQPANSATFDASFSADVPGSYRMLYVVGDGTGTNRKTFIFRVTRDANGIVYDDGIPDIAFGETVGDDNVASNDRSYAKPYELTFGGHIPVISNHTALLNRRAAKHRAVYMKGFFTDRDGGEGLFYWDSTSSLTHIPGMTVQPGNGTAGAMATGRWVRSFSGHRVHGHWFGMKPADITFNNLTPFSLLKAYTAANGYEGEIDGKRYELWDTFVPATQATFDTSAPVILSAHEVVWGVKDQTVLAFRCPAASGPGGDPSVPAQIPAIPFTLTPIARSTAYGFGANVYSHGHSYTAIVGGISSASAGAEPSGVFSGGVVDGTVTWRYNDLPYRGGAAISVARDCVGAVLGNIIFDGLCTWVDNTVDPPGYADYTLPNPGGPTCPLMYAQPRYDQATYAYGWDVHHKGIWTGIPITPSQTNQDRNRLVDCTLRNFRGEAFYGDGQDGNNPHTTWEIFRTTFTESVVGISSSSGIKVYNSRFNHLDQAFDTARGLSDFEVAHCFIEDCRIGIQSEQGLQTQAKPGMSFIHHCVFRNCYTGGVRWGASFGGTFAPAVREFRLEDCVFFDCGWGASAIQVGADVGALNAAGVKIRNNTVHVGALVAPTRTGGQVGTIVGNAISLAGIFLDLEVVDNRSIVDDIAVTNGKKFDAAMAWLVNNQSNVDKIRVTGNKFDFSDTGLRLVPPTTTTDQVMGFWKDNDFFITGRTLPNVLMTDNTGIYAPGDSVFPKMPEWKVVGSAANVITSIPSISHPERWAYGQIVRIANGSAGNPVLFAQSSATHRLKGPRIFPGTSPDHLVELVLIRGSTDPQTNTPFWYELEYRTIGTREEPQAQEVSPSFALVESFAPAIEMWSCHITHLLSGTYNYFKHCPDEDGKRVQVYCAAGTILHHNSAVAPAGTVDFPKLLLIEGADYTFATGGESHFVVDNDAGIAVEVMRIDGAVVTTGLNVLNTRTLTGTAPIRVDGDNAPHNLSANRTLSIDPTAYPARSTTFTGGTGVLIDGDHAAHDLSANRTVTADTTQVVPTGRTLTGGTGIFVDGDHAAHDLSANRTISIDITGVGGVPTGRTLTGATPVMIDGDHAAHDLSNNRTIGLDPAANITTTGNLQGLNVKAVTPGGGGGTATMTSTGVSDGTSFGVGSDGGTGAALGGVTSVKITIAAADAALWTTNAFVGLQNTWTVKPAVGQSRFVMKLDDLFWAPGRGLDMGFVAGDATGNGNGGTSFLEGGQKSGSGLRGGATLCLRHTTVEGDFPLVEVSEVAAGRFVTCLAKGTNVSSVDVPAGSKLVYIGEMTSRITIKPGTGVALQSAGGQLVAFGSACDIPVDVTPRGTIFTGQGRPSGITEYAFHIRTSGAGNAGLVSVDLSAWGDGTYLFEFYVLINNLTLVSSAAIRCAGCWELRGGVVHPLIFPYATDAAVGGLDPSKAQGPGASGAGLLSGIFGTSVIVDALPGGGNAGNDTDWSAYVTVRRAAFS